MPSSTCAVCLRSFSITASGLLRTHGPVTSRCPGSGKPPRPPAPLPAIPVSASLSSIPPSPAVVSTLPTSPPPGSPALPSPPSLALAQIPKVRVLKRIPKSARQQCSSKLTMLLKDIVGTNSMEAWNRLFLFTPTCLRQPRRGRCTESLASLVKGQLQDDMALSVPPPPSRRRRKGTKRYDPEEYLARRVSAKIEEGDFKGAIRLASSDDTLADVSDETYNALCAKHPPPHLDSHIPSNLSECVADEWEVSCAEVSRAILSFPCGSSGGPDKLRPQHLKDLIQHVRVEDTECPLLVVLAEFCALVLRGDVPQGVRPFFFGASLVALKKKCGGVRPIAVGCTLRRLVAKIACKRVADDMAELLAPTQLGYGVRGGSEAAVHAARCFITNMDDHQAVVKLDFANAFNSIRRDCMLKAVNILCPSLYSLVHSAYASPSNLLWEDLTISSAEGVQQGDPLGPLLFCLVLHQRGLHLRSVLQVLYLDDVTLGGNCQDLLHDIQVMKDASDLGLSLNVCKCEIISTNVTTCGSLLVSLPGSQLVSPTQARLLGSPIGDDDCVSAAIQEKVQALERLGERLKRLKAHDALLLLRNCFALPKLMYILRTAPCFRSSALQSYDDCLREILSHVTNNHLESDSSAWEQATLPVGVGGLGIRSAVDVAPSAYLASSNSSAQLIEAILPESHRTIPIPYVDEARASWSTGHECGAPEDAAVCRQKAWDSIRTMSTFQRLLDNAADEEERARLLAVTTKESGAWLRALPVTALGLRMDDNTVRVAVGLRLGTRVCGVHTCQHCAAEVGALGRHSLSCRRSGGRFQRHAALNDIFKHALSAAHMPSKLEPTGLSRTDGRRPDGVTLAPWKRGQLLVWDATCPDTFAPSYRTHATTEPGRVAALAEEKKADKYRDLPRSHWFCPLSIESMGAMGPRTLELVRDVGRRIAMETGEPRSTDFLLQRLSVAVQRGNCALVLGGITS